MFEESDNRYYDRERKKNNVIKKNIRDNLLNESENSEEYNNFCYYLDRINLNMMGFNIEQVKLDAAVYYNSNNSLKKIKGLNNNLLLLELLILLNGNYSANDMMILSQFLIDENIIKKIYSIKINNMDRNFNTFVERLFYTIITRFKFFKLREKKYMDLNKTIDKLVKIFNNDENNITLPTGYRKLVYTKK